MRLGRGGGVVIYREFDTVKTATRSLILAAAGFALMASAAVAQDTYVVRQGDTLASIARQIAGAPVSWEDLCRINSGMIEDCDRVRAGVVIALPEGARMTNQAVLGVVGEATPTPSDQPLRSVARRTIAVGDPLDGDALSLGSTLDKSALQDADANLAAFLARRMGQEPDDTVQRVLEAVMSEPVAVPETAQIAPAAVKEAPDTAVVDAEDKTAALPSGSAVTFGMGARPMAFETFHGHDIADFDGAIRLSGHVPGLYSTGTTGGAFIRLDDDFEADAANKVVRVSVTLSGPDGARAAVAYSTNDLGNSGWRAFVLTAVPTIYSFDYAVPPLVNGNGDFIGVDPDPDGAGHAIQVHAILLEILESDLN